MRLHITVTKIIEGVKFKIVNICSEIVSRSSALRRSLVIHEIALSAPFQVHPYSSAFRPGIAPGTLASRSQRQIDIPLRLASLAD
jgi:hypothetical protein